MEDAAAAPPTGSPHPLTLPRPSSATAAKDPQQQQHWRNFDNSVNAVSFGFVATAILISMFLVMAIFERFLRSASPEFSAAAGDASSRRRVLGRSDLEGQMALNGKLSFPSPKMTVYTNGVSVLMPGDKVPTFIAHRAPVPCLPERMPWPPHQPLPRLLVSSQGQARPRGRPFTSFLEWKKLHSRATPNAVSVTDRSTGISLKNDGRFDARITHLV